jgi:hypothetical protein
VADRDEVLEEGRRSLVRLVNDLLSELRRRFPDGFRQYQDALAAQVPRMSAVIGQANHIDDVATRLDKVDRGWEERAHQFVNGFQPHHPVYENLQLRAAAKSYFDRTADIRAAKQQPAPTQDQPTQDQPVSAQGQPAQSQASGVEGTSVTFTAPQPGPVKLNLSMLQAAGSVTVEARKDCTRAQITMSTPEKSGAMADAVRGAAPQLNPDGSTSLQFKGPPNQADPGQKAGKGSGDSYNLAGATIVNSSVGPNQVVNNGIELHGSATMNVGGQTSGAGSYTTKDGKLVAETPSSAPVNIHAIVPEGSSATCTADSANVATKGRLDVVQAKSGSGNVSVEHGTDVTARSGSGGVSIGSGETLKGISGSGDVEIGDGREVTAKTGSGNITVGRGETLAATSGSGDITVGRTSDARLKSSGDVNITDLRGNADVHSVTGGIEVQANAPGGVTAGSVAGPISVNASAHAVQTEPGVTVRAAPGASVQTSPGVKREATTSAGTAHETGAGRPGHTRGKSHHGVSIGQNAKMT